MTNETEVEVLRDDAFEESVVSLYSFDTTNDRLRAKEVVAVTRHRIASRATDTALVEDLMSAPYEWRGPFGKEKHRIIPPALFDRILAVLEGKRT